MIKVTFEINGKKVNRNNLKNALEAAAFDSLTATLTRKIGSLRCPEHNRSPKLIGKGQSLDGLSFEVSGCCENLMDKVKSKVK